MREFERIDRIVTLIKKIWENHQDLRFNQLINHLQRKYKDGAYIEKGYIDIGKHEVMEISYPNLFNVEDDKFEEFLMDYLYEIEK